MTKVLIVDDEPALTRGLARAILHRRPDYAVLTASGGVDVNGSDAAARRERTHPERRQRGSELVVGAADPQRAASNQHAEGASALQVESFRLPVGALMLAVVDGDTGAMLLGPERDAPETSALVRNAWLMLRQERTLNLVMAHLELESFVLEYASARRKVRTRTRWCIRSPCSAEVFSKELAVRRDRGLAALPCRDGDLEHVSRRVPDHEQTGNPGPSMTLHLDVVRAGAWCVEPGRQI
jgi:hypothetical protein